MNREFINDLQVEQRIKEMNDRELMEFTARQVYDVCSIAGNNTKRIVSLERRGNKIMGIIGGVGTFVGAIIVAVINYFAGR